MKDIDNKRQILFFLDSLVDKKITEGEVYEFKMELTEVIFKPKNKRKKAYFCKQMDVDVFESILEDLELPYKIRTINESPNTYVVEKKEE